MNAPCKEYDDSATSLEASSNSAAPPRDRSNSLANSFGNSDFEPFFDDFTYNEDPYSQYIRMLDFPGDYSVTVRTIAERIMQSVHDKNIDVMIEVDDLPVLFSIPYTHMAYLLGEYILNASRLMERHITVIAEEISFSNTQRRSFYDSTDDSADNSTDGSKERTIEGETFDKNDYLKLIELLRFKMIDFALETYRKSFTYADDQPIVEWEIAKYIASNVFNQSDIEYRNIFDPNHSPSLIAQHDEHTIHCFNKDHPLIVRQKLNIDMDLSGAFINLSVVELHSRLMDLLNNYRYDDHETVVLVDTEDDYQYINILTKNVRNGSVSVIYHPMNSFIESCRRFYRESMAVETHWYHDSADPIIKHIIRLHDIQKGLTNDDFDYPDHPPESPDELPKPIRPIIYQIGKEYELETL